jgi:large subunit ribosomal protein L18
MTFRRHREKKTDYRQRLALIKSQKVRMVVRRSLRGIRVQFVRFSASGDTVIAEQTSKSLAKYGWVYHSANLPAAYLVGYMAGAEALSKGVKEAILDAGLQNSVKFSSLYCAATGAKDAGISIPTGSGILPPKERISGKHIVDYAAKIRDTPLYHKQFSFYLKKGVDPGNMQEIFEHTKKEIAQMHLSRKV